MSGEEKAITDQRPVKVIFNLYLKSVVSG